MTCPVCARGGLQPHVFREAGAHLLDGVLTCACGAAYAVDDGLLELVVPELLNAARVRAFARQFATPLSAVGVTMPTAADATGFGPQLEQREHFDWFAWNDEQDYSAYQASPFWMAADAETFHRWRPRIAPGALMLDVGCANGRSAWPLVGTGATVVGCDISPILVRQAIDRAARDGYADRSTFMVADCDRLPFAADTFDAALTYGVLHHLPDPARACREIQRVLKPGGVHLGSENNRTIFRAIFDAMMRWRPLWIEKAGAEPLISAAMLRSWTANLPASLACRTSVFVPPHVINLFGRRCAPAILTWSDVIGRAVPGLDAQGGLIVFEVEKSAR